MRALSIEVRCGALDATLHTPAGTECPLPAVVMFTDVAGLRPCFELKAQTLADAGYAVLLPNIHYRLHAGPVVPKGKRFEDMLPTLASYANRLTPDALAIDFAALLAAIDIEPEFAVGGLAAVGYCRSGGFTLRMAALHPDRVVAAAAFHSSRLAVKDDPLSPTTVVDRIKARVYLGHADRDDYLPADQIGRMDQALAEAGVHFTTEYFKGARHGFSIQDSAAYDPAADALHFKRLQALLEETLTSPPTGLTAMRPSVIGGV